MKKSILAIMAVFVAAHVFGAVGATTNWVVRFVESRVSEIERKLDYSGTTENEYSATYDTGNGVVSNTLETATVGGIVIADCSPTARQNGITNGMLFAWSASDTAYRNGDILFRATISNLTYAAYSTTYINSQTWFIDSVSNRFCRLVGTLIQPSVAEKLVGGVE